MIAGLGVAEGIERDLGPLAAGYVLILAIVGPLATRYSDALVGVARSRLARVAVSRLSVFATSICSRPSPDRVPPTV